MSSWKNNIGKFLVTNANEIDSEIFGFAAMSNKYSYGVFKILPYNEELFPEVNYKIVLEPIEQHKYIKRAWYIMDIESSMSPNCFNMHPKTKIFDNIDEAILYANKLNT